MRQTIPALIISTLFIETLSAVSAIASAEMATKPAAPTASAPAAQNGEKATPAQPAPPAKTAEQVSAPTQQASALEAAATVTQASTQLQAPLPERVIFQRTVEVSRNGMVSVVTETTISVGGELDASTSKYRPWTSLGLNLSGGGLVLTDAKKRQTHIALIASPEVRWTLLRAKPSPFVSWRGTWFTPSVQIVDSDLESRRGNGTHSLLSLGLQFQKEPPEPKGEPPLSKLEAFYVAAANWIDKQTTLSVAIGYGDLDVSDGRHSRGIAFVVSADLNLLSLER